jgi:branched-chain amino acid aminotransferase
LLAYVNGELVPDTEARISIFDRGLLLGDAVFDTIRTYGGRICGVAAHTNRLRSGLRYVEMDPSIADTVEEAMIQVNEANKDEIRQLGDVFIVAVVTRGQLDVGGGWGFSGEPTVIVYVKRLDLAAVGELYDRGVDLKVSLMTRHFSGNIDARAKTVDRLGLVRGELKEARFLRDTPEFGRRVWHVVFNDDGSIAEAQGANLAILDGETLVRPLRHTALHGTSLETLCRLAEGQGFSVIERPIYLYDLLNARAAFITASSFSMLPVTAIDGVPVQRDDDVFRGLVDAWIEEVDFDFVEQSRAAAAALSSAASD